MKCYLNEGSYRVTQKALVHESIVEARERCHKERAKGFGRVRSLNRKGRSGRAKVPARPPRDSLCVRGLAGLVRT